MTAKRRIAVVTPFLDKRHGTERCVAEQVERLARDYGYEVHIYSRRVEDMAGVRPIGSCSRPGNGASIVWHKVPDVPAPGLVRYLWWFMANHLRRWWDSRVRRITYDLLYSPGINCIDADAVAVHIVFAAFYERIRSDLAFHRNPPLSWPRILHRRMYYRLIMALERTVYPRKDLTLATVSRKTAQELACFYGRDSDVSVVYNAVDTARFFPLVRERLRLQARHELGLPDEAFCVLLIGNDWRNKGLSCLLDAVWQVGDRRLWVLVVGRDFRTPFETQIRSSMVIGRVLFPPPRHDVEFYYAAADAYVGPSLHDSFALPPIEAMACGLPVIVSAENGGSEIVTDGVDGLILKDPRDAKELAGLIRCLVEDADLRHRLGEQAVHTAQKYTWDRNAAETAAFLENAMRRRRRP